MRRAREQAARADLVLWVIDATAADRGAATIAPGVSALDRAQQDGPGHAAAAAAAGVAVQEQGATRISISATTGAGLDALIDAIVAVRGADHSRWSRRW